MRGYWGGIEGKWVLAHVRALDEVGQSVGAVRGLQRRRELRVCGPAPAEPLPEEQPRLPQQKPLRALLRRRRFGRRRLVRRSALRERKVPGL